MNIYLIRHGLTEANEKKLYCGKTDLPLSPAGRAALSPQPLPAHCRLISSGLKRANETLVCLFGNVPYAVIPELREMDFGAFEMQSYEDLKDDPAYVQWCSGENERNIAPGGESGEQMTRRVINAFEGIVGDGQDAVIVTHGGCIAAIMAYLFPEEQKNRFQWQCPNGHGYTLTFTDGEWHYG